MELISQLPALSPAVWLLLAAGALIVGLAKTALPGAASIAVALFALALPAKESTGALLLLLLVGDAMALWVYRRDPDVPTLLRLMPSVLVGVVAGAVFFTLVGSDVVRVVIGLILLLLVAVTVWRRRRTAPAGSAGSAGPAGSADDPGSTGAGGPSRLGTVLGRASYGCLGGFTTMVANAGGPVMSLYFLAMRMPVVTFLGTAAWFFAVVNVIKLPFSAGLGLITRETLVMDAVLVPLVLLGGLCGARIARRIPQALFERIVLGLTVVSALALLIG